MILVLPAAMCLPIGAIEWDSNRSPEYSTSHEVFPAIGVISSAGVARSRSSNSLYITISPAEIFSAPLCCLSGKLQSLSNLRS